MDGQCNFYLEVLQGLTTHGNGIGSPLPISPRFMIYLSHSRRPLLWKMWDGHGDDTKPVPSVGVTAVYVGIGSNNLKVKEKMTMRILRTDHGAVSWRMNHMEKSMEKAVVAIWTSFTMEDGSHRVKREMESYPKVEYIHHI